MFNLITPSDLGLPAKFSSFRKPQREALDWLQSECTHQISAACLPTGAGKTLIANTLAKVLGVKATYLVATKALQSQVLSDFASSGMVDLRGRANYACPNYGDCDTGADAGCSLSNTVVCPYAQAVQRATESQIPVTNYAYWLHSGGVKNKAFQGTELLICDEAHALESQLAGYAEVKVYASELRGFTFEKSGVMQVMEGKHPAKNYEHDSARWYGWAATTMGRLEGSTSDDDLDLVQRAKRVTRMNPNWVWQFDDRGHCTFEPVRLAQFSKGLFGSVPRVLLMSASLNEFTLKLLIPSDVEYDYRSWGSVFSPANAPVYHIPTVKLNWRSTDEDYKKILTEVDNILAARSDRRGIIHAVSYARMRRVLEHSRFRDRFFFNDSAEATNTALDSFRSSKPNGVLVSPSFAAGYDFPGSQAEFQIILKFPFPNETQRVIKERCTQIPGYRLWSAAQEIVQMCGRARRYEVDRCECIAPETKILTDDLRWVQAGNLLPGQRLLAFDENGDGRKNPRRWKFGEVIKARTWVMDRVRVVFEDGEMITTPNHPWLTIKRGQGTIEWCRSDQLKRGKPLFRIMHPWKESPEWEAGWLAGFMDGEGCLVRGVGKRNPCVSSIMISQNEGLLLDTAQATLSAFGFDHAIRNKGGAKCKVLQLKGGYNEVLRLLGQIRPHRLLNRFLFFDRTERISAVSYPRVLHVERLTPGPITSLQTSTKTYVAEGMGAHNTFILDNSVKQLCGPEGRSYCPPGFRIFTVTQVPPAPPKLVPV